MSHYIFVVTNGKITKEKFTVNPQKYNLPDITGVNDKLVSDNVIIEAKTEEKTETLTYTINVKKNNILKIYGLTVDSSKINLWSNYKLKKKIIFETLSKQNSHYKGYVLFTDFKSLEPKIRLDSFYDNDGKDVTLNLLGKEIELTILFDKIK